MENQLREFERVLAARRKSDHGQLVNKIVGLGNVIKTEKLSYKAFQKMFGRSVKQRAPGMFGERLNRKAESAGGKVVELNTRALKLSQFDHTSNTYTNKPLLRRAGLCVDESVSGKAPAFPTVAIPSELIARQRVLG